MFTGFVATTVIPVFSLATPIMMNMLRIPKWLWKIIIEVVIYILTQIAADLRVAPPGTTTTGNVNMNSIRSNPEQMRSMAE